MAIKISGKQSRGKAGTRGRMPSKTSINLVPVNENRVRPVLAIPGVLIVILLAGVFSKFAVYDRLMQMSRAEGEVARLRSRLEQLSESMGNYTDVEDTYAHYTINGMSAEELALVDRVAVLDLVKSVMPLSQNAKSWSLTGNVLTIEMTESSLSRQNALTRQIEENPIVDSCTIMTANKKEQEDINKEVWARFVVYLKQPAEEVEEQ